MKTFITAALSAIFILLDLFAGNLSVFCGLSCYCAIVIALAYGLKHALFPALFSAAVLDSLYGRSWSVTAFIFAAALATAFMLIERGHRQLPAILSGGAAAGSVISIGTVIFVKSTGGTLPAPDMASYIVFSTGSGGVLLLLLIVIFDFFAGRANLPRCIKNEFSTAGSRRRKIVLKSQLNSGSGRRKRGQR